MRRAHRQVFDLGEIKSILETGKICWLGIPDGEFPYVLPVHYGYSLDKAGRLKLYFHGARAGRKFGLLQKSGSVGFSIGVCDEIRSDGENACEYTAKYASIVGTGNAAILRDPQLIRGALGALMDLAAGKGQWEFSEKALENTAVFEIDGISYTAKSNRNG